MWEQPHFSRLYYNNLVLLQLLLSVFIPTFVGDTNSTMNLLWKHDFGHGWEVADSNQVES